MKNIWVINFQLLYLQWRCYRRHLALRRTLRRLLKQPQKLSLEKIQAMHWRTTLLRAELLRDRKRIEALEAQVEAIK